MGNLIIIYNELRRIKKIIILTCISKSLIKNGFLKLIYLSPFENGNPLEKKMIRTSTNGHV